VVGALRIVFEIIVKGLRIMFGKLRIDYCKDQNYV